MSDTSTNSDLTHIDGHACVLENDVSITTETKKLGVAPEMMNMAVDSKIIIFCPTKKDFKLGDTLAPTQAMTWSQSVLSQLWILMTLLTILMRMMSFCFTLFPELFAFVSDLESELDTSTMDEAFRLNSDYCPLVATAPTIPMPSLLDTKNQSNMMIQMSSDFV
jgi:hypothetical protein